MAPRRSSRKQTDPKSKSSPIAKPLPSPENSAKKTNKPPKSNQPSTPARDPLKPPSHKKPKSKGLPIHVSPRPFKPATQRSGNEAAAQSRTMASTPTLVRFDLHICASGEEFCRAPWTKPLGHRCVMCKSPVHSFCYGQAGETIPTMCALCVSPIGVMAGVIAPIGKPEGFDKFYKAFLANEVDDIGILHQTNASNVFTPSGLKATSAPFTPRNETSDSSEDDDIDDIDDEEKDGRGDYTREDEVDDEISPEEDDNSNNNDEEDIIKDDDDNEDDEGGDDNDDEGEDDDEDDDDDDDDKDDDDDDDVDDDDNEDEEEDEDESNKKSDVPIDVDTNLEADKDGDAADVNENINMSHEGAENSNANNLNNAKETSDNPSIQVTSVEQKSFDVLAESSKSVFSGNSDNTAQCKNTDRITVRVFVCQMVPKFDKDKNFHTEFASCFNRFMSAIIALDPLVRLIKWDADSADVEKEAVTAITRVKSEYKQYIYCSFRGESAGKKYLRIQLSIPSDSDIDEILSRLQDSGNWWEGWNCFARQVGSNATQPITIGWFLRSSVVHIGSKDLQNAIRVVAKDPLLGLEFQKISQKPKQVVMNYRKRAIMMKNPQKESVSAVHVEVQEGRHRATLNKLEKIYNGKDCPLGINFHFVRHIDMPKMQTRSGRGGHAKCVTHQYAFELMVDHASTEIHNIDKLVSTEDGDMSLRQALMALKVKTIKNCIGDKLFLSINRESPTSNTFLFEYHLVVEAEASELVEYLPVFIRDVFIANPKDYCDYGVCKDVEFMKWDEAQRCGIDPEMENFETFVEGLPDVIREDGEDGGFDGLDPLSQAMYKRAVGDCDETLMSDTSRHKSALGAVKNIRGEKHSGIEIDLDGASIRSALSTSTSTSKVDAAKQEITAEFTLIIDNLKNAREKEKDETNKVLEIMREELANTRLMMERQSALLASLAPSAAPLQPNMPHNVDPSSTTAAPVVDPLLPANTTTNNTNTSTPVTDSINTNQNEPGSGSNGAEAP